MTVSFLIGVFFLCSVISQLFATWLGLAGVTYAYLFLSSLVVAIASTIYAMPTRSLDQRAINFGFVLISFGWTFVYSFSGPFDLVPSDIVSHLFSIKTALQRVEHWEELRFIDSVFSAKGNLYGYMPTAAILWLLKTDSYGALSFVGWFAPLLLLLSTFELSFKLFGRVSQDQDLVMLASMLATLLFPIFSGVDKFSYIRAYGFSAGLFGYILFLLVFYYCVLFFDRSISVWRFSLISFSFIFCQYLIHEQEAIFSILILFLTFFGLILRWKKIPLGRMLLLFTLVLLVSILSNVEMAENILTLYKENFRYLVSQSFRVIDLFLLPILFLCFWKIGNIHDRKIYLAFLFIPLLSVFNPVFVWLINSISSLTIIYRFWYIFQSHIIIGLGFILVISSFPLYTGKSRGRLRLFATPLIFFFCLLLAVTGSSRKIDSFFIHESERVGYWSDMLVFLNSLPEFKRVYTDPVTGYLVSGMTKLYFSGHKFVGGSIYTPMSVDEFVDAKFPEKRGSYVILNLREGSEAGFGARAGHWPSSVLRLSSYYSSDFIELVLTDSDRFKKIWSSEDDLISVFIVN